MMLKDILNIISKRKFLYLLIGIFAGIFISQIFFGKTTTKAEKHDHHASSRSTKESETIWTCSMHPQIKLPKPGKCPLCGMDLIPMEKNQSTGDEENVSLKLSETGRRLAEVVTETVKYKEVFHEVRLVGKVDYDETKLSYISAWIPGRIDRLFVDFTGTRVRKGDHLIKLYSPELLATQEEYLQAIKNFEEVKTSELSVIKQTAGTTLKSAREKLRLYGIDEKQIDAIVARGTPDEHMTINSPVAGTVIHKNGFEGMYVKTGDKIYTIADLSKVWLFLDAYESDIQWLHYGQRVTIKAEGYPGEVFQGKIAFIEPFVDKKTRTIKLRVNVDNKREKLKPGMFVRATIKAVAGVDGKVYEEDLAGKWICPMHPDIIKDNEGTCDLCEMNLIKTSEFGFAEKPIFQKKALVIPKTTPLITGKRAVVYVENQTDQEGIHRYVGREVTLGPRAGDYYVVLSGLSEGEKVVTNGNFKIDSALQIQAKPSMMNPAGYYSEKEGIISQGTQAASESTSILSSSLPFYLSAATYLAKDNEAQAAKALNQFKKEIIKIQEQRSSTIKNEGIISDISILTHHMSAIPDDVKSMRELFSDISKSMKRIFEEYEYTEDLKLYLNHCPMAFDGQGAYWIQDKQEIQNPYFGAKMLKCGATKSEYGRKIVSQQPAMAGHHH